MSAGARSWEVLLRGRVEPVALRSPRPRSGQVGGRQSPGSRRGPRPRTWGPVRGAPSLPSPGEAGSAGRRPSGNQPPRPERRGARRARVSPRAVPRSFPHLGRRLRRGPRDADPGLCASPGDRRGVQVAEPCTAGGRRQGAGLTPGRGGGEGGARRRRPAVGDPLAAPSPRAPRTVLMRAAQPL